MCDSHSMQPMARYLPYLENLNVRGVFLKEADDFRVVFKHDMNVMIKTYPDLLPEILLIPIKIFMGTCDLFLPSTVGNDDKMVELDPV